MKKLLFCALAIVASLLLFTGCSDGPQDTPDNTEQTATPNYNGYPYSVKFRMPDDPSLFTAKKKEGKGNTSITLSSDGISSDYYAKEQFKNGYTDYVYHYTYLGLYSEPNGGELCFNANGVWTGISTSSGIYYARFDSGELKISYGYLDESTIESLNLPTTLRYGDTINIDRLPVIEKQGYTFLGWRVRIGVYYSSSYPFYGYSYRVTNAYGEFIDMYKTFDKTTYSGSFAFLKTPGVVNFYPEFEGINDVSVIFDYNDGTFRQTRVEHCSYEPFLESEVPAISGNMKSIVGWSLDPNSKEIVNFDELKINEDTKLYAVWDNYRYICVITEAGKEQILKVSESEPLVLDVPTKDGYVFAGWYDNELSVGVEISGEVKYTDPYEYYYARWEKAENDNG